MYVVGEINVKFMCCIIDGEFFVLDEEFDVVCEFGAEMSVNTSSFASERLCGKFVKFDICDI